MLYFVLKIALYGMVIKKAWGRYSGLAYTQT